MQKKTPMTISEKGLELIRNAEGLRLKSYRDQTGKWTIGYGHTKGVLPKMVITAEQADDYLRSDIATAEEDVNTLVKVELTQHQFDALVSFTYNLGRGKVARTALLKKINAGNHADAATEFGRFIYGARKAAPGLVKRRAAERAMFEGREASLEPTKPAVRKRLPVKKAHA